MFLGTAAVLLKSRGANFWVSVLFYSRSRANKFVDGLVSSGSSDFEKAKIVAYSGSSFLREEDIGTSE